LRNNLVAHQAVLVVPQAELVQVPQLVPQPLA
jgi:hypothetical protein